MSDNNNFLISNTGRKLVFLLVIILSFSGSTIFAQNITRPNIVGPSGLMVNSYTGSLFYQRTDMFIPGRGLNLDITFTYNSANRNNDYGYGFGWTFFYNRFYKVDTSGISFYNSDGRVDKYTVNGTSIIPPKGIFDSVANYAAGKYKLLSKDGTQYFFDDPVHKKLTGIIERNGNRIDLTYTSNNLTSITDPSGRIIQLTWTTNRLSEIKANFSGSVRTCTYTYNPVGALLSVKNPLNNTISYTYARDKLVTSLADYNGNLTNILYNNKNAVIKFVSCESEKQITYNEAGLKTIVADKNGSNSAVTTYAFDTLGRLINKSGNCCGFNTTYSYDEDNNINQVKDANGNITTYAYDSKGNILSEIDPLGQSMLYKYEPVFSKVTRLTDKKGNQVNFVYDNRGNLIEERSPLSITKKYSYDNNGNRLTYTDPRNNLTTFTYNSNGYLATIVNALSGNTTLTFDQWGNAVTQKDPNNNTTNYTYDALNHLLTSTNALAAVTTYTYDANGNRLTVKDANNNTTTFFYNSQDNIYAIKDPNNITSTKQYDALQNVIAQTDANGNTTFYEYDKLNRLTREINAGNEQTGYTYDGNGNKITTSLPNGNTINSKYDALNRLEQVSDNLGIMTTYSYDANSNKISEKDALGNTITYRYDAINRLTAMDDPLGKSYGYLYDANSNLIKQTDRNGNNTLYAYDVLDRRISNTDALNNVTAFSYDNAGNMLSVKDAKNNITSYTYDALNRKTVETFADNTTKNYAFDPVGNLASRKDNAGNIINYNYDKLNRPVRRIYPNSVDSFSYDAGGRMLTAKNATALVSFTYDVVNRVKSESLNGKTTGYSYNVAIGVKTITYPGGRKIERQFDNRNNLKAIKDNNGLAVASFSYDLSNRNTSRTYANGVSTTINYNANSQVTDLISNPNNFVNLGYSYDDEGNPLTVQFRHIPAISEQYGYDVTNQLRQFTKGGSQQSQYNYDGVGNRVSASINGTASTYTVNNMNGYTSIVPGNNNSINYDGNGNVTNDGNTYQYDYENRITTINNGNLATYLYDALGRRVQKFSINDTVKYLFDGLQIIEERNGADILVKNHVWGSWLDDIVSTMTNTGLYYFHTNPLGSIIAITDSVASLVERYEYDGFGRVKFYDRFYNQISSSLIGNSFLYTGRQYESESDLYYYRARYYNPLSGRFQQRDPYGYIDGTGLYCYVNNNTMSLIDPLGTFRINCNNYNPSHYKTEDEIKEERINKYIIDAYNSLKSQNRNPTVNETLEEAWSQAAYNRSLNSLDLIERDVEYYLLSRQFTSQTDFNPINELRFVGINAALGVYNLLKTKIDLRTTDQPTSPPGGYSYTLQGSMDGLVDQGSDRKMPSLYKNSQPNNGRLKSAPLW